MDFNLLFFVNSILFGAGLAMDAFSVSLADGLAEPEMRKKKMITIAGVFGIFQTAMPLIGWICVHTVVGVFSSFEKVVPWIALILLLYIGGKMIIDAVRGDNEEKSTGAAGLLMQGIATSIDALSVGFTIASYPPVMAITEALIIGIVTFIICMIGIAAGKKVGMRFSGKAEIIGGIILIFIGIEIFVKSL